MSCPASDAQVDAVARECVARLEGVSLRYASRVALDGVDLEVPAGRVMGLIGPDGVGKSSMLALIAGARRIQAGQLNVLGGDMADAENRRRVCPRIAYMPQGLGRNLYPTLSVFENVDCFGRLFGHDRAERRRRIAELLGSTGLAPFADRPVGKLSGGMKQKLGLCCALIHDPDLLVLDEPTTGIDPLSRRQFWDLVNRIRAGRPGMSVIVATAYMEEAARFDYLAAMDDGRVLAEGTPTELLKRTGAGSLEEAFVLLLPESKRTKATTLEIPPRQVSADVEPAIEADGLSVRFGDFVAVDRVSFRIEKGEIFGFLGSNGCGKTTTMKVLTGLLPASGGHAKIFGEEADAQSSDVRRRVGYMSQSFSLYTELTVRQNLVLHARLYDVPGGEIPERVASLSERFDLNEDLDLLPSALPLGKRQRLSLAVALVHRPELLILDEPTSGVDPLARDIFWRHLVELSRRDLVTIFISTHYVNEASRCDRISLMHAGKVLVSDAPATLIRERGAATLEDAFIGYLEDATSAERIDTSVAGPEQVDRSGHRPESFEAGKPAHANEADFSLRRMLSYAYRESLELRRDPVRGTLAILGSVILVFITGYGITFDVEQLTYALLDRDRTTFSRDYASNLAGSRYFSEEPELMDYADMDRRMVSGQLAMAVEIPSGFGRDLSRGRPVSIGVWIDGGMPQRAETIRSYVEGMHLKWLAEKVKLEGRLSEIAEFADIRVRFRYNPDVKSLVAMVPALIPMLLILIPAMLSALAVVREKELGSIVNLYVTPVTRLEFLLGKQIPYAALALVNYAMLTFLAVTAFDVPLKGSLGMQAAGAILYVLCATALGLFISTFMRSQVAAIFGTAMITIIPATQFSGMLDPVSSLEGPGAIIGRIFPMTYFLTIERGTYSKALGFDDLKNELLPMAIIYLVLIGVTTQLLPKQER